MSALKRIPWWAWAAALGGVLVLLASRSRAASPVRARVAGVASPVEVVRAAPVLIGYEHGS